MSRLRIRQPGRPDGQVRPDPDPKPSHSGEIIVTHPFLGIHVSFPVDVLLATRARGAILGDGLVGHMRVNRASGLGSRVMGEVVRDRREGFMRLLIMLMLGLMLMLIPSFRLDLPFQPREIVGRVLSDGIQPITAHRVVMHRMRGGKT